MPDFQYVYILLSECGEHHYVGCTADLQQRLNKHNNGDVSHTSKFRPWRIQTAVAFRDVEKAAAFERYLKSHSGCSASAPKSARNQAARSYPAGCLMSGRDDLRVVRTATAHRGVSACGGLQLSWGGTTSASSALQPLTFTSFALPRRTALPRGSVKSIAQRATC